MLFLQPHLGQVESTRQHHTRGGVTLDGTEAGGSVAARAAAVVAVQRVVRGGEPAFNDVVE